MDITSTLNNLVSSPLSQEQKIEKVAGEFESMFVSHMLKNMFESVDLGGISNTIGGDIYKDMMVEEYGKVIADAGGIGVADHVKRQLLEIQGQV